MARDGSSSRHWFPWLGLLRDAGDAAIRYLLGRDIFISYSRADAIRYAPALANRIRAQLPKVSVYMDQWIAPPEAELPASLLRACRWSSLLVVVVTEEALRSRFVGEEIEIFSLTRRPIIPIQVGELDVLARLPALEKAVREQESRQAVHDGNPSEAVVMRIARAVEFTTREQRLEHAVRATLAFIVVLVLAAAIISGSIIGKARTEASSTIDAANQKLIGAFQETRRQKSSARIAAGQARAARIAADAAVKERSEAMAEAQTQRERAEARRRRSLAESLALTAQRELAANPASVPNAARLYGAAYHILPEEKYELGLRTALHLLARRSLSGSFAGKIEFKSGRFSDDGETLAVLSKTGQLLRLNLRTGALRERIPLPEDGYPVATPGGHAFVSKSAGGEAEVRDALTGVTVGAPQIVEAEQWISAISKNGRFLVIGGEESFVVRDAEGAVRGPFTIPENARIYPSVAVSDDGKYVAIAADRVPVGGQASVWLMSANDRSQTRELFAPDAVQSLDFTIGGPQLVAVTKHTVHLWDVPLLMEKQPERGEHDVVIEERQIAEERDIQSAIASDSGRFVAVITAEPFLRVIDALSSLPVAIVEHDGIHGAAFSPNEQRLLTWGTKYDLKKSEMRSAWNLWDLAGAGGWDVDILRRPGGAGSLTAGVSYGATSILLFDPAAARLLAMRYPQPAVWLFDRDRPDGERLAGVRAVAGVMGDTSGMFRLLESDATVSVWRAGDSKPVDTHRRDLPEIPLSASVGDGGRLAAWFVPREGQQQDAIVIASFLDGRQVRSVPVGRSVAEIEMAEGAPVLAYTYYQPEPAPARWHLMVIDARSAAAIASFVRDRIPALALSADGRQLAMATSRGVSVHDLHDRIETAIPEVLQATALAFSKDGRFLAVNTRSENRIVIHIWDLARRTLVASLPRFTAVDLAGDPGLRFDATGEWIWLPRPESGGAWAWRWSRDDLIPSLCRLALPPLTAATWHNAVDSDDPLPALCNWK